MKSIRLLRMAWAGALTAAAFSFLYLAYAPITGSRTAGTLLTIGAAFVGAVTGAVTETGLERSVRSRLSIATVCGSLNTLREGFALLLQIHVELK